MDKFIKIHIENQIKAGATIIQIFDSWSGLITKDFYIIQTLIALCPVLGLLGTVTGMIEVFDVVSFFGTGNARALASGITKATLPTMTGMAISIVGLLTFTGLNSKSQSIISEL